MLAATSQGESRLIASEYKCLFCSLISTDLLYLYHQTMLLLNLQHKIVHFNHIHAHFRDSWQLQKFQSYSNVTQWSKIIHFGKGRRLCASIKHIYTEKRMHWIMIWQSPVTVCLSFQTWLILFHIQPKLGKESYLYCTFCMSHVTHPWREGICLFIHFVVSDSKIFV